MRSIKPLAEFIEIRADAPSLDDNTADIDRLRREVAGKLSGEKPRIPYRYVQEVAARFRRYGFSGTAVVNNLGTVQELVDFIELKKGEPVGMALDLGTTHLEASLTGLVTGKRLAAGTSENSQIKFGADILSRVHYAASQGGRAELHDAVIASINELAADLSGQAGLKPSEIRALTVSGNTAMTHFFLNFDTHHLIREPYIPLINVTDPCHAVDLGLVIHPAAPVWSMPSVGSYFGGDLVSGIIASGMGEVEKTSMLIDVGTNAEVIVGNSEWLIACAGAAGPALEGGVAKMGMRAGAGAIEHVEIDKKSGKLSSSTIGGGKPKGICGSGIIDLVAALYLTRVINIRGKFRVEEHPEKFIDTDQGPAYVLASGHDSEDGRPVVFGQVDLDAVMRSKAAMYSILTTLVNQVGTSFEELDQIYVAGAFGKHIAPKQAITLGMLPDLPLGTFKPIGNSSLAGAEKALREEQVRRECLELVRKITYLELNVNQEFMIRFSGSRFIPHTDHSLFPSVPFFNDN